MLRKSTMRDNVMKFCWEQWCLAECNWNQFQASPMQSSAAVWQFGLERSAQGADCDRMIYPLDWGASVGQVQAIDCFSRARRLRTPWNPFTEWSSCIVGRPDRLAMYLFQLQIRRIDHLHSARLLAPWSSSWIFHQWYEWCWEVLPKGVESPPPPNDLPSLTALLLCQEAKRQRWWHV